MCCTSSTIPTRHSPGRRRRHARAARLLPGLELPQHTGPIHRFAARYAPGLASAQVLGEEGSAVELVPSGDTLEALRKVLHRLVVEERIAPWQIDVLTGVSLARSAVWKHHQFVNEVLWDGSHDELGQSLGLPADQVPDQPSDTILCDSIHRFKGLEREVIILVGSTPQISGSTSSCTWAQPAPANT